MPGASRRAVSGAVRAQLGQGVTPEKIALSIVLGLVLGVTPVLGSTSLLCLVAAVVFRLNLPTIQAVNYLVAPLQLALLLPFYRIGERMFSVSPLRLSLAQLLQLVRGDVWHAVGTLWAATLRALVAWGLIGTVASLVAYAALTPALRRLRAMKLGG